MTQVNPFASTTPAHQATPPSTPPSTQPSFPVPSPAPSPAPTFTALQVRQQEASEAEEVSFDDDIKFSALERFPRLKMNESTRIGFLVFTSTNAPSLLKVSYFYDPILKEIFNAPKDPQLLAACVKKYGEPKIKFGTIVIRYETDMYGNVLSANYQLYGYTFSTDKWPTYKNLHKEWGLDSHDVQLTCREDAFQKIDISPLKNCLYAANPDFAAQLKAEARALYDNYLPRLVGRQISNREIEGILSGVKPSQNQAQPGAMPTGFSSNPVNPFNTPLS